MPSRPSSLSPTLTDDSGSESALHIIGQVSAFRVRPPKRDALTRVRHDLCSLVHSVVGYSDLLTEPTYGSLSPEQTRFVTYVRSAAEQLQELVETCLELSRPDNDQFSLKPVDALVGQLLRRVQSTFAERGVVCELTCSAGVDTRMVSLDVAELERALLGLGQVLARKGSPSVALKATLADGLLTLNLSVGVAAQADLELAQLEDQLANRDFIRLTLAELLLGRAEGVLRFSKALETARVTLPLQG